MKSNVKHSCGHFEEVEFSNHCKIEVQEEEIQYLEKYGLCEECKEREFTRWEKERDAVKLLGTNKQVNWARNIRKTLITEFEEKGGNDNQDQKIIALRSWLLSRSAASFWIDVVTDERKEKLRILIQKWESEVNELKYIGEYSLYMQCKEAELVRWEEEKGAGKLHGSEEDVKRARRIRRTLMGYWSDFALMVVANDEKPRNNNWILDLRVWLLEQPEAAFWLNIDVDYKVYIFNQFLRRWRKTGKGEGEAATAK